MRARDIAIGLPPVEVVDTRNTKNRLQVWEEFSQEFKSILGRIGKVVYGEDKVVRRYGENDQDREEIALLFGNLEDDIQQIERCLANDGELKLSEQEKIGVERILRQMWKFLSDLSQKLDKGKYLDWAQINAKHILQTLEEHFVEPYFVEEVKT
ncbi:MAG: hypothetical protein WA057_00960 [Candidatus Magasanikiibacteriota bacterium]